MNFKDLRIIFMGTPEFAVASLQALMNAGCNVIAVVTAPDKPAGRGMKMNESAVKQYAVERGLQVLQPEKLKNAGFIETLRQLKADLQIVVAFRMLPEVVWNMPPMGTVNLHGSLLPAYRGAAPINWAIINGEKQTGVTTFQLQQQIDTGNILLQEKIAIRNDETAGELHDEMKETGAQLLVKTVQGLAEKTIHEVPQLQSTDDHAAIPQAPKIFTETCHINWSKTVDDVYNLMRGLSPYPAAFTIFRNKKLKIYTGKKEYHMPDEDMGDYLSDGKTYLKFACGDGYLHVLDVQMEGKKRMLIPDFLRGFRM